MLHGCWDAVDHPTALPRDAAFLLMCPVLNPEQGDSHVLSCGAQGSPVPACGCCCRLFPKPFAVMGPLENQRKHLPLLHD